ncbi:hypothetical protein AOZ06_36400 [Kibdelosporangium phytohabitans]|uniref:Uncharacterized protein n=1 Tax=Kibdelosporangium phytohabitans TaxID=860235 RepID=A0A0N9I6J2_9PSEU|nr:hypothetical protein AOZ06_36400 [Kibdelosporangium phytohabitans]
MLPSGVHFTAVMVSSSPSSQPAVTPWSLMSLMWLACDSTVFSRGRIVTLPASASQRTARPD